jgi:DTW domain-containing protein YfiP
MLKNVSPVYIGETGWEKEVEREISRNDYTPAIFFPIPNSWNGRKIIEETGKPLNIFVPDTSWRNARRWLRKPMLVHLRKIGLTTVPTTEYHLRKQSAENHLCTFQAVISLLSELNSKDFETASLQIDRNFKLWVKSLAKERGLALPRPHRAPQNRNQKYFSVPPL